MSDVGTQKLGEFLCITDITFWRPGVGFSSVTLELSVGLLANLFPVGTLVKPRTGMMEYPLHLCKALKAQCRTVGCCWDLYQTIQTEEWVKYFPGLDSSFACTGVLSTVKRSVLLQLPVQGVTRPAKPNASHLTCFCTPFLLWYALHFFFPLFNLNLVMSCNKMKASLQCKCGKTLVFSQFSSSEWVLGGLY